jgi:peptide/nickel transport system substrate-binding protein
MLLQRHDGFVRRDARWPGYQLPFMKEVRYFALAAGVTVQAAMRSRQIDFRSASDFVEVQDLLSTNPELIVQVQGGSSDYGVPWALQHNDPLLADVRVRRALSLGINRNQMIETLFGGNASAGHLISWNWLGYPDPLAPEDLTQWQQHDPARARQLLADAGYPNGFEIEFVIGGAPAAKDVMIQQMLAEIGVRLTFKEVERVVATSTQLNKTFRHAIGNGIQSGYDAIKVGRENFLPTSDRNFGSINDPVLTDLVERVTYTIDFDEQRRLLKQIHERELDQAHFLHFHAPFYAFLRQPWLHTVHSAIQGHFPLNSAHQMAVSWISDTAPGDRAGRLKA